MKPNKISSTFSGSNARAVPPPTRAQIEALAHAIWLDRGCPEGRDLDQWLEAERQLRDESRIPEAAGDISATSDPLDPDRSAAGRVGRELERIVIPPAPRSPTAL